MMLLIALILCILLITSKIAIMTYEDYIIKSNPLFCEQGYGLDEKNEICRICLDNQYSDNGRCKDCPTGTTSNSGSGVCYDNLTMFKLYSDYVIFYDKNQTPYINDRIMNLLYFVDISTGNIFRYNSNNTLITVSSKLLCYYLNGDGSCIFNKVSKFNNNLTGCTGLSCISNTTSGTNNNTSNTSTNNSNSNNMLTPQSNWNEEYKQLYSSFYNMSNANKKEIINKALSNPLFNPKIDVPNKKYYDPITDIIWDINIKISALVNTSIDKVIYVDQIKQYLSPIF